MEEYGIQYLRMDIGKRKEHQDLVVGVSRSRQRHPKICIKVKNREQKAIGNLKNLGLLQLRFYSFETQSEQKNLCEKIYRELNYAMNKLEKPDLLLIKSKQINIQRQKSKVLLLDLDETLIYSDETLKDPDVELFHRNFNLKFNVRPHCRKFIKSLSSLYDIFIFTSSTLHYAEPIIKYLNEGKHYIKGVLHREHCLKTKNGFYIKDLRIIKNVPIKDIVIVDNNIYSFSFHLDNGIPVQEFMNNADDKVLISLQQFLAGLACQENVQDVLREKLGLRKMAEQGSGKDEDCGKMEKIDGKY